MSKYNSRSTYDNFRYMLRLAGCALGACAPDTEFTPNLIAVAKLAQEQHIVPLVCEGVFKAELDLDENAKKWFSEAFDRSIVREAKQTHELAQVGRKLDGLNIRFVPLKGMAIKRLYPEPYLRSMADIDILIDEKDKPAVRDAFVEMGYDVEEYDHSIHDTYVSSPLFCFEVHHSLFDKRAFPDFYDKFSKTLSLAEKADYGYRLPDSELYAHLIAHYIKHFIYGGGGGVSPMLDIWLCRKKMPPEEIGKADKRIADMNMTVFEKSILAAAEYAFGNSGGCDDTSEGLLETMYKSTAFGTNESYWEMKLINRSGAEDFEKRKLKSLFRTVFPPAEYMKKLNPILKKCIILLPVFYVTRIFRIALFGNKNQKEGLSAIINSTKSETLQKKARLYDQIGLTPMLINDMEAREEKI